MNPSQEKSALMGRGVISDVINGVIVMQLDALTR